MVGGNSEKYIAKESTKEDNDSRGHHGSQKYNLFVSYFSASFLFLLWVWGLKKKKKTVALIAISSTAF